MNLYSSWVISLISNLLKKGPSGAIMILKWKWVPKLAEGGSMKSPQKDSIHMNQCGVLKSQGYPLLSSFEYLAGQKCILYFG